MNNKLLGKNILFITAFVIFYSISLSIMAAEPDSLLINEDETVRIDSIRLTGNVKTEEAIILREMTFIAGDTVTGRILRFNRERIYSLGLFNRVDFFVTQNDNLNILEIVLAESWYLYPLPYFKAHNNEFDKATYGVNFTYKNFRGKNETLRAMIGLGYEPVYAVTFDNPSFSFENNIGLSITALYLRFNNKSTRAVNLVGEDFRYKIFSQSVSLSKRFNTFNIALLTLGFSYYENNHSIRGITASGGRIDRMPSLGISYQYDSRDLKQYSKNGLYAFLNINHKGFGINKAAYNNLEFDFREYRSIIDPLSGKWRVALRTSFGNIIPFYDYSYLGYYEKIRGHFNEIREGKSYFLSSFELSFPIVRDWNFSLKLPLLPESLTSTRIGIYLTGFIDSGDAFGDNKSFSINNFYSGYGFGITILFLPFNAIRFEYAFNESGRGELIIGTGFSF
ncbi:MAG: POTRA domain-containing protein [Melioribacteraceae bacterium]